MTKERKYKFKYNSKTHSYDYSPSFGEILGWIIGAILVIAALAAMGLFRSATNSLWGP